MSRTVLHASHESEDDLGHAEQLLAAAARNDRAAFDRVFEAWLDRCYRAAWRSCGNPTLAQLRVRAHMLRAVATCAAAPAPPSRSQR